jgi:hypothetical protein
MSIFIFEQYTVTLDGQFYDEPYGYVIYFTIGDFSYSLSVYQEFDMFHPVKISHMLQSNGGKQKCLFCDQNNLAKCEVLTEKTHELFSLLIKDPKIRMEWLYLPVGKSKGK